MVQISPLISIIVPVFKTEQYLRFTLSSILSQTFANWEAILIDDCSPDNSGKICDEFAEKDKRFKVIHKEKNEGTMLARKSGLDIAKGIYIAHLDSDDSYHSEFLEKMYSKAQEINGGYDMVFCGYNIFNAEGKLKKKIKFKKDFVWEKEKEKNLENYFTKKYSQFALWNTLIKKEIYDKVIFPNIFLTHREDTFIYFQLCFYLKNVAILKENLYSYINHINSSSHRKFKTAESVLQSLNMEMLFYNHSINIINTFNNEKYLETFARCFAQFFVKTKFLYFSLPKEERAKLRDKNVMNFLKELDKFASVKQKVKLLLYSLRFKKRII